MKKKKKKKKSYYKLKVKDRGIAKPQIKPNQQNVCITCGENIVDIHHQQYMGNNDYRHKEHGPGTLIWASKFPSPISFSLYLHTINAVDFFEQQLKERGYTEERFFRTKNAPQNFLIRLKKHLKTLNIGRGASMVKANKKTRISKSGNFKSIRHLLETMFAKNKNITKEELNKAIKKEYPDSAFLVPGPQNTHFNWYRADIVGKGKFTQIPVPAWAKNIDKSPKKKKDKKEKKHKVEFIRETAVKADAHKDKVKKKKHHVDEESEVEQEDQERAKKVGLPSKLKLKKKNPLLNKVGPSDEELEEIENGDDDLNG